MNTKKFSGKLFSNLENFFSNLWKTFFQTTSTWKFRNNGKSPANKISTSMVTFDQRLACFLAQLLLSTTHEKQKRWIFVQRLRKNVQHKNMTSKLVLWPQNSQVTQSMQLSESYLKDFRFEQTGWAQASTFWGSLWMIYSAANCTVLEPWTVLDVLKRYVNRRETLGVFRIKLKERLMSRVTVSCRWYRFWELCLWSLKSG